MLFFGHIGITAGVGKACDILLSITGPDNSHQPDSGSSLGAGTGKKRLRPHYLLNGFKGWTGSIDYRVVLVGSLLPDFIDKPVWLLVTSFASDVSISGRDYAHTLMFNLALFIGGLVLVRYRKSWLLVLSLSSFIHLIFDQMWNSPVALLWPLLGPLTKGETVGWLSKIIQALFSQPEVYMPEIIGLAILLLFAYRLMKTRGVISFIRDGVMD